MMKSVAITCACLCLGSAIFADPPRVHPVPDPKPESEAIPEKYADQKKVSIVLEKIQQQQAFLGMQITLRIINPTKQDMVYNGAYASSPEIRRQQWVDGRWKEAPRNAKPGFNPQPITLPAGQSVVFVMGVSAEQMPSRVGIDYTSEGKAQLTVWSDRLER